MEIRSIKLELSTDCDVTQEVVEDFVRRELSLGGDYKFVPGGCDWTRGTQVVYVTFYHEKT